MNAQAKVNELPIEAQNTIRTTAANLAEFGHEEMFTETGARYWEPGFYGVCLRYAYENWLRSQDWTTELRNGDIVDSNTGEVLNCLA